MDENLPMRAAGFTKACLVIAGVSSTAMALYHFGLPTFFNWEVYAVGLPPVVHWALFSLNFFFSFLLLCGGVATILVGLRWEKRDFSSYALVLSMGCFWLANGLYQTIRPMPLPERLALLQWFLLLFGYTVSILYLLPCFLSWRRDPRSPSR